MLKIIKVRVVIFFPVVVVVVRRVFRNALATPRWLIPVTACPPPDPKWHITFGIIHKELEAENRSEKSGVQGGRRCAKRTQEGPGHVFSLKKTGRKNDIRRPSAKPASICLRPERGVCATSK